MSSNVDASLVFPYLSKLCSTIESYTMDHEKNDPDCFNYRGVNLKYAVERHLYFRFIESSVLFEIHRNFLNNSLPEHIEITNDLERELAFYFCDQKVSQTRFTVTIPPLGVKRYFRGYRTAFKRFTKKVSQLLKRDVCAFPQNTEIVFFINHQRFINFLSPILKKIKCPYVFIHPYPDTQAALQDRSIPYVNPVFFKDAVTHPHPPLIGHLADEFDSYYSTLSTLKPSSVVVLEGSDPVCEVINQVCRCLSIKCICIQQGWDPTIQTGFRNLSFDRMLVWGNGFSDLLKPFNPNQRFVSVGNHLINCFTNSHEYSQVHLRRGIAFFLATITRTVPKDKWEEILGLIIWTAQEFKSFTILIREHPRFPLNAVEKSEMEKYPNIKFVSSTTCSLQEVLDQSRVSVSMYSSTIYESIAAHVPPVLYNACNMPYIPDVNQLGVAVEVKNIAQAKVAIKKLLMDDVYYNTFQPHIREFTIKYFAGIKCGDSVDLILNEIQSTN